MQSQQRPTSEIDWKDESLLQRTVEACTRAIAAHPEMNTRYIGRAEALMGLERWREAIADFSKALELDDWMDIDTLHELKKDVTIRVLIGRGRAYGQLKDYEALIQDYSSVIELSPKSVYALRARGYAYEMLGSREKASADYRRVLELNPNDHWAKGRLLE